MDRINIDISTFLRLLELAKEEVKDDEELHFIAEIVSEISNDRQVTMSDYEEIYNYSIQKSKEQNLDRIKKLSGLQ